MNETAEYIKGMADIYGREVLTHHYTWYNSFDDLDFTAVPFEPFVNIQDYEGTFYRIPSRLQKYFIASLTKNELDKRFDYYRTEINYAA